VKGARERGAGRGGKDESDTWPCVRASVVAHANLGDCTLPTDMGQHLLEGVVPLKRGVTKIGGQTLTCPNPCRRQAVGKLLA
jgi:hypothetical protein